jgi:hypothetical protein
LSQIPETDPGEAAARAVITETNPRALIETPPPVGTGRLSSPEQPPPAFSDLDPLPRDGERPTAGPPQASQAASFELLWPLPERPLVRDLEAALGGGDHVRALGLAEQLVARALAGAAAAFGTHEAPRDPVTVALVLGVDSRRYLEFRALARDARAGRGITAVEALGAYAFAMQVRLSRATIAG